MLEWINQLSSPVCLSHGNEWTSLKICMGMNEWMFALDILTAKDR